MGIDGRSPVWFAALAILVSMCLIGGGDDAHAKPETASLVIEATTGRILHGSHADARRHPASLTKMMTLYMVFEALDRGQLTLNQRLPVSAQAAAQPPSKLALKPGSRIAVRDAILALVTKSANDVATVIAEAISGTEAAFARAMTDRARQLGMSRTTFRNASGLPDPAQVSTARDMATLALALLRHFPQEYAYFSTRRFAFGGKMYQNHNKLLESYGGTDGIKTGYIRASGFNLVASAKRGRTRLIGVVFGGPSPAMRNQRMASLLDDGFAAAQRLADVQIVNLSSRDYVAMPPDLGVRHRPAHGRWGVQVGAFRSRDAAIRTALAAQSAVARDVPGLPIAIERSLASSRGPFHLARLVGAGREEAYQACRILKQTGLRCLVLKITQRPTLIDNLQPAGGSPSTAPVVGWTSGSAIQPQALPAAKSVSGASVPATSGGGQWGVQVGAFSARSSARSVATEAVRTVPEPLQSGAIEVVPIKRKRSTTLYGARVIGISRGEAYEACRQLEINDFRCMVVRL